MKLSGFALCSALLAFAGCAADEDGQAPGAEDSNLLPDGATGIERVVRHGETIEIPWVAKDGMKYIEDDFAIGPALVTTPYLSTPDALGEWANNVVPYCIVTPAQDSHFGIGSADQTRLVQMLGDLEDITPLDFQRFECNAATKPAKYIDYRFWDTTTGNQTVGGVGHSGWTIDLVHGFHNPDVWHETGHALGFMHEQKRQDRASFVNYYSTCVTPASMTSQYSQIAANEVTPYDIDSIMQYSSYSFATYDAANNIICPPLLFGGASPATAPVWGTYNGTTLRGTLIGQSQEWSLEDINGAYTWYEPALGANETNDMLGTAMVSADFDGDGYDDLAVGAMGEQPSSGHGGAVFLYKGTMNGLVAWMVLKESQFGVTTHSNDDFGMALAAGDLDGDGIADLAVGAPLGGSAQGGAVYVYQGGRGGPIPLGAQITQASTGAGVSESGDMFGTSLAIGKLYGGSKNYLAIGAPWEYESGVSGSRGMVSIVGWSTNTFTFKENFHPSDEGISIAGGMFGYALAAGDINQDGIADLAVGAPAVGVAHGNVAIYLGHSAAMTAGTPLTIVGTWGSGDRFGYSLFYAKTGTGSASLAVGAPGRFGGGRAFMYLPFPSGTGYAPDEHMEYDQSQIAGQSNFSGDSFGESVAMADLDGDGNLDMMVGTPNKTVSGKTGAGQVALYLTHVAAKVVTNVIPSASDNFGHALAVGNFDRGAQSVVNNARIDFAVSSPYHDLGTATNAGVFGAFRGSTQALWRSFNQATHNGP